MSSRRLWPFLLLCDRERWYLQSWSKEGDLGRRFGVGNGLQQDFVLADGVVCDVENLDERRQPVLCVPVHLSTGRESAYCSDLC